MCDVMNYELLKFGTSGSALNTSWDTNGFEVALKCVSSVSNFGLVMKAPSHWGAFLLGEAHLIIKWNQKIQWQPLVVD